MTITCKACGESVDTQAHFCPRCGEAVGTGANADPAQTVISKTMARTSIAGSTAIQDAIRRAETAFGSTAGEATRVLGDTRSAQREQLILCCDVSPSMDEGYDGHTVKIDALKRAAVNLILNKYRIDPDDEIGIVIFAEASETVHPLTCTRHGKRDLIQTIQELTTGGYGTSLQAGLEESEASLDWSRSDVVRRIVLITDGHGGKPFRVADGLKSRGTVIDVIGIGRSPRSVNEKVLKRLASIVEGEQRYRFVKDSATLIAHYTGLATKTATATI